MENGLFLEKIISFVNAEGIDVLEKIIKDKYDKQENAEDSLNQPTTRMMWYPFMTHELVNENIEIFKNISLNFLSWIGVFKVTLWCG